MYQGPGKFISMLFFLFFILRIIMLCVCYPGNDSALEVAQLQLQIHSYTPSVSGFSIFM